MVNPLYADIGLQVAGAVGGYLTGKEDAKLAASVQRFQNKMRAISGALSLNAITENEAQTRDQNTFANVSVQVASMQEQADFAVEAAAAGIKGNSVIVGQQALVADAARAQTSRRRAYKQQLHLFDQQKKDIRLQMIYGKDVSPIKQPSIGASLMGLATGVYDSYQEHTPDK